MLSDREIKTLVTLKEIIEPFEEVHLQPCSYDLGIDSIIYSRDHDKNYSIDTNRNYESKKFIEPHEFLLASTVEYVKIPNNVVGQVVGKSSIGRLGLFIENAGLIDPGFEGNITLELYNASNTPIDLSKLDRICQIIFTKLNTPALHSYDGHYQGQVDVTESYLEEEMQSGE